MKTLPTLFKKTSTGAIQQWSIGVEKNNIIVVFGQQGGKLQRTEETIKDGKNIGKSNETSPADQALAEATSKWEGKIKKGYVEDVGRASAGEKDIDGGYDCMLAHKFADHGHKIKYPAFEQPKLNGHRCEGIIENGVAKLYSRTRKPITSMPHVIKELETIYPKGYHEVDGELYNHAYKDKFEELASLIRQEVPADNCTEVQYHIYDYPSVKSGFKDRADALQDSVLQYECIKGQRLKYIKLTDTILVEDEEQMLSVFDNFIKLGYEGGMARNMEGPYEGKRSYHLQKIKKFEDADFAIVGIKEGKGGYAGCGIFICKADNGDTFDVKMRGSKERLKQFLEHPRLWKDKELVVKYQYISKYGIPIFPVGERFKE